MDGDGWFFGGGVDELEGLAGFSGDKLTGLGRGC